MISYENIKRYRNAFPKDSCAYDAASYGEVIVTNGETGESFKSDLNETDEVFLDRLQRSIEQKTNLFYIEWQPNAYKQDCLY